jgi:hypothetical protein
LPDIKDIQAAIPPEGIKLKDLTKKFVNLIDDTNACLFAKIVQQLGQVEMKILVKPLSHPPDLNRIVELRKEAARPAPPRPVLESNQSIESKLKDGATVYVIRSSSKS